MSAAGTGQMSFVAGTVICLVSTADICPVAIKEIYPVSTADICPVPEDICPISTCTSEDRKAH